MNSISGIDNSLLFVNTDDGCRLAVRLLKYAADTAPTIVLIHALAMDSDMWTDTVRALTMQANVYAVDCRGHGQSDKPAGRYDIARFSEDMCCVLDHLKVDRAVVVGCSMGGTIALGMAGRYPERVAGLVAIDTTASYGEGALSKWSDRGEQALREGMASLADFQCERWFSAQYRQLHPQVVNRALDVFLANDTKAYYQACLMLGRADERALLPRYKGPARIVVGEDDYATPISMSMDIQQLLPNAVLQVIPEARHYTPIETPKSVAANIDSVLASL
jgi:3-oxoadipate enol-lactonase